MNDNNDERKYGTSVYSKTDRWLSEETRDPPIYQYTKHVIVRRV